MVSGALLNCQKVPGRLETRGQEKLGGLYMTGLDSYHPSSHSEPAPVPKYPQEHVIFSYFSSSFAPVVSSFSGVSSPCGRGTVRSRGLTLLASLAERGHFLPNGLCRGLATKSHWSVLGHVCLCEPITVAKEMECFDWPGLGHVPHSWYEEQNQLDWERREG